MNKLDYDRRRESDSFHPCYLGLNTVNRMLERNILLPQGKIDIFFPKTDSKTISSWSEFIPTGYTDSKTKSGSSKYYDNNPININILEKPRWILPTGHLLEYKKKKLLTNKKIIKF